MHRFDALKKVTGQEKYAIDYYPEGVLWCGVRRAEIPCGRLRHIDLTKAATLPRVVKILTAKDITGTNKQGIIHKDMPVIASDVIRYTGDPVALVIAKDKAALKEAIEAIGVDIEPQQGVFSISDALKPNNPLVHTERVQGNILAQASINKGNALKAIADSPIVIHNKFTTQIQAHAFLETENGVAWQDNKGIITIIASTQAPFRDRFEIAHALGIDFQSLRIIAPLLGGGFGGKDGVTVQCILALASMHTQGIPVKMVWEREESLIAGYKRHATIQDHSMAVDEHGTIKAYSCELIYDTGAYAHLGAEVMGLGMEHATGPYAIRDVSITGKCVYTNNPVAGAMRAFGVCQASFAFEQMIDMAADRLGMDKLEIRLKNALNRGDTNPSGVKIESSIELITCLETIRKHRLWQQRGHWKGLAPRFKKRGAGLACVFNAMGYGKNVRDTAIAKIELNNNGSFTIYNSVSDMGQGNSSAFVQIASEILCQDIDRFTLIQPDTSLCHPSGSSSAGRTTYCYGNALIKACNTLKDRILNRAGLIMFVDSDENLKILNDKVVNKLSGKEIGLKDIVAFLTPVERVSIEHFVAPVYKDTLDTGEGIPYGFPHVNFTYGAHLALIEVDQLTGFIEVKDYLAVTDGGGIINRQAFDQQIEGGVAQGIGYAIMEDFVVKEGKIITGDLSNYIIPTSEDMPEIISIPVESFENSGPFGIKGVGEVAINGPLPAIANALYDACGIRLFDAPLTPEKVLRELNRVQYDHQI